MLVAAGACSLALAGCKGITVLGARPKMVADVVAVEHAITAEELMIARHTFRVVSQRGGKDVSL